MPDLPMDIQQPVLLPQSNRSLSSPASRQRPLGLYIHIPFCEKKCPYCDFNTYAKRENLFQPYVDALCVEIEQWGRRLPGHPLHSIFLGGGTPTVLPAPALAQLLETVYTSFRLVADCEITSEANPGAVDRQKFAALRALGVNRLSMGVQSFQPEELAFLGRIHRVEEVDRAYGAARDAGFTNINLDFMFGLPGQLLAHWQATLERALTLAPEHLSLYSLIVEPNTPLHHWVETGQVRPPDDDQAALLYQNAMQRLAAAGYVHYEVSNWAKPGAGQTSAPDGGAEFGSPAFACRHNLLYWRNQEYIGVGPGAHSYLEADWAPDWVAPTRSGEKAEAAAAGSAYPLGPSFDPTSVTERVTKREERAAVGVRWSNHRTIPGYIKRMAQDSTVEAYREQIEPDTSMGETMMLGLRLLGEGVPLERFARRYGVALTAVYRAEVERFTAMGLLALDQGSVRLTPRGLMVGNQVFAAFLP